jgi:hypothetical protein
MGCSVVIGADFDVHRRKSDATVPDGSIGADAGNTDGQRTADSGPVDANGDLSTGADGGTTADGMSPANVDARAESDGDSPPLRDGSTPASETGADAVDEDATGGPYDARRDDVGGGGDDANDARDANDSRPEPPPDGGHGPPTVSGGFVSTGLATQTPSGIELRGHVVSNATISGRTAAGISIEGRFR